MITGILVTAIDLYVFVVLLSVVMSWLVGFNIVPRGHPIVQTIGGFTAAVVDPVLRPIQRVIPAIGGIDLSPLILLFALQILRGAVYMIF